jgi:hypothetical protein
MDVFNHPICVDLQFIVVMAAKDAQGKDKDIELQRGVSRKRRILTIETVLAQNPP